MSQYMDQGYSKLNSWWPFGKDERYENAAELFEKAANIYKLHKDDVLAVEAFMEASKCYQQIGLVYEEIGCLVNAAICKKQYDVLQAIKLFNSASEMYEDQAKFFDAIKCQKMLAETYEKENMLEDALSTYQKMITLYNATNNTHGINTCRFKIANLAIQLERYNLAIQMYEEIASNSRDTAQRFACRKYYLIAGLSYLALNDVVSARKALDRYIETDISFANSREEKLLSNVINAIEDYNLDDFTHAVVEFDSITPLDSQLSGILLKVRGTIITDIVTNVTNVTNVPADPTNPVDTVVIDGEEDLT